MKRLYNWLRQAMSWEAIRGIGEWQILTRASYLAILFIPILAGLWPAVRVVVNGYNVAASRATDALSRAHDQVSRELEKLESITARPSGEADRAESVQSAASLTELADTLEEQAETLRHDITRHGEHFAHLTVDKPCLPAVWGWAYFGALFVVLGHFFYQAGAPEIVRQYMGIDYEAEARRNRRATTATPDQVEDAGEAAKKEYNELSNASPVLRRVAVSLYALGLLCIFVVICLQILAVSRAL